MSKSDIINLSCNDDEMHYLYLGDRAEGRYYLIYARKNNYSSLDDFLEKALALLDAEEDLTDCWDSYTNDYRDSEHIRVENPMKSWKITGYKPKTSGTPYQYEKHPVTVIIDNIVSIVDIGHQEWDDSTTVFETETDYFFYHWYTSA